MAGAISPFHFILFGSAALSLIYLLVYCFRPANLGKSFFKTASILALAVGSLLAAVPVWVTCALLFCALGDYLLSVDKEAAFLAGVGAFALGHVFYIVSFLGHSFSDVERLTQLPWMAVSIGLLVFAAVMAVVLFKRAGDLRFAVLGYVPVIVGMGIFALTIPAIGPLVFLTVGALFFVFSDFILSLEMFVIDEKSTLSGVTPFAVWSTYWLAQVTLLIGFATPIV